MGADVGAAVASDFGLVADPAEGHPDEGAPERAGHRLTERGLADSRGPDQGQDGASAAPADRGQTAFHLELADSQMLENPILDVTEAVVVLIEDSGCRVQVDPVLGFDAPGQLEDGVEPGTDPSVLGALLRGPLELSDLSRDRCTDVFGKFGGAGPRSVVVRVGPVIAGLAQLVADGLELATQQEFALGLLHPLLDVGLDPFAQRQVGQYLARPGQDRAQAFDHVDCLEDGDLLGQCQVGGVAGEVGHPTGFHRSGQAVGQAAGTP